MMAKITCLSKYIHNGYIKFDISIVNSMLIIPTYHTTSFTQCLIFILLRQFNQAGESTSKKLPKNNANVFLEKY